MAINSVTAPFFAFADTAGKPLESGFIYIGQPGLEAQSSPKASFFDVALTIPTGTATGAAVRTSGGYPVRNGSAAVIYVDGDFSVTVKDKNGVLIFSRLNRAIQVGIETTSTGLFGDGNLLGAGIGFGAEPTTGLIRSAANQMRGIVNGSPIWQANASDFSLFTPLATASGGTGFATMPASTIFGNATGGVAGPAPIGMATLRTMQGWSQSLAENGYVVHPGGMIVQYITTGAAGSGVNGTVTFPIVFPNLCAGVVTQMTNTGGDETVGDNYIAQVRGIAAGGFTIRNLGPSSRVFFCIAVGY